MWAHCTCSCFKALTLLFTDLGKLKREKVADRNETAPSSQSVLDGLTCPAEIRLLHNGKVPLRCSFWLIGIILKQADLFKEVRQSYTEEYWWFSTRDNLSKTLPPLPIPYLSRMVHGVWGTLSTLSWPAGEAWEPTLPVTDVAESTHNHTHQKHSQQTQYFNHCNKNIIHRSSLAQEIDIILIVTSCKQLHVKILGNNLGLCSLVSSV